MGALAAVLHASGRRVSGTDRDPQLAARLAAAGIAAMSDTAAAVLPEELDCLVYSDAVSDDDPQRQAARLRGIRQVSYSRALGAWLADRQAVGVAGTHGKSTTAHLLAAILAADRRDPSTVIGARRPDQPHGGRLGHGQHTVVEACEYRRNFRHLPLRAAILLSIEADHFDCFADLNEVEAAFAARIAQLPADGLLVALWDCDSTRRLAARAACRVVTCGLRRSAHWRAEGLSAHQGRYAFWLCAGPHRVGRVQLAIPGRHNVQNAVAAAALAGELGVPGGVITRSLSQFAGVARRLECHTLENAPLVDDYAHHPTEIRAALAAVREMHPGRWLRCVFQPHQHSRTVRLLDELARSLQNADEVWIAPIDRVREGPPLPTDVTAADLARRVTMLGTRARAVHREGLDCRLLAAERKGDVQVILGAGEIGKLVDELVERV